MTEDRRVPLSAERHRDRFWRRFASYDFVRPLRQVPLVMAEIEPVAAAMPVVFASGAEGPEPVALLRLVPGGPSAFVSPAGLWLASYVPSILRVHPFSARPVGDGRMVLLVDEGSGLVTGNPADEPFFGPDGGLAPATAELVGFFRQREASALRARAAVARLAELGLLVPFAPAGVAAPEGAWAGLMAVDRARFEALDDAAFLDLRRRGALGLVQAHFVSLAQVAWLARAEAARDEAAAAPARPAPAGDLPSQRGIDDFLAALAAAQAGEGALAEGLAPAPAPRPAEKRH